MIQEISKGSPENPKTRQMVRIYAELHLAGVFSNALPLLKCLRELLKTYEEDPDDIRAVSLALSFVKSVGQYFLNHLPHSTGDDDIRDSDNWVDFDLKDALTTLLHDFFRTQCRLLTRLHTRLSNLQSRGRTHFETKGELSSWHAENLISSRNLYDTLKKGLTTLSALLGLQLPQLDIIEEVTRVEDSRVVFADTKGVERLRSIIFDDEEERAFFEDLINLEEIIPSSILYPAKEQQDFDVDDGFDEDAEDLEGFTEIDPESLQNSTSFEIIDSGSKSTEKKTRVENFYESLSRMSSRQQVDQAACDFCFIANKAQLKVLGEYLVSLPVRRTHLIRPIARFLAIIKKLYPTLISSVNKSLSGQFTFLSHKKVPLLGTRGRICRFIGEAVKAKVFPQSLAFACLKRVIVEDMTMYNIDMAALLLETCGRFLLHQPESHNRINYLMDVVEKKRCALRLDSSQVAMLLNALYATCPPDIPPLVAKIRTPRHQFLLHLINTLSSVNAAWVFEKLRRWPWISDKEAVEKEMRVFSKPWKVSHAAIAHLALVFSGIYKIYPEFSIRQIDSILEFVHSGLETPSARLNARLVCCIMYIADLYSYAIIDSSVLLELVYNLMSLGHPGTIINPSSLRLEIEAAVESFDGPWDHFRVRLICTLLTRCAHFLITDPFFITSPPYLSDIPQLSDGLYLKDENHPTTHDSDEHAINGSPPENSQNIRRSCLQANRLDRFMIMFEYYLCTKTRLLLETDELVNSMYTALGRCRSALEIRAAIKNVTLIDRTLGNFLLKDLNKFPEIENRLKLFQEEMNIADYDDLEAPVTLVNPHNAFMSPKERVTDPVDDFQEAMGEIIAESLDNLRLGTGTAGGRAVGAFDVPIPMSIRREGPAPSGSIRLLIRKNKSKGKSKIATKSINLNRE